MQMGFYFDQTRCTGCFTCRVACKDWHDIPAGPANWVRVSCLEEGKFPQLFVAYLFQPCYHCANAPCVSACPAGAIRKREEDGIVVVDRDECLGESVCGAMCKEVCPYDSPQFGKGENPRMQKCDLCLERWPDGKKPICVEACPLRALDAGPVAELGAKYGGEREGAGFVYSPQANPAIFMKGKRRKD